MGAAADGAASLELAGALAAASGATAGLAGGALETGWSGAGPLRGAVRTALRVGVGRPSGCRLAAGPVGLACGLACGMPGGLVGVVTGGATGAAGCGKIGRTSCRRGVADGGAINPSGGPCTRDGAGAGAGAGGIAASCAKAGVGAHMPMAAAAMRGVARRVGKGKVGLSLRGVWPP